MQHHCQDLLLLHFSHKIPICLLIWSVSFFFLVLLPSCFQFSVFQLLSKRCDQMQMLFFLHLFFFFARYKSLSSVQQCPWWPVNAISRYPVLYIFFYGSFTFTMFSLVQFIYLRFFFIFGRKNVGKFTRFASKLMQICCTLLHTHSSNKEQTKKKCIEIEVKHLNFVSIY